MQKIKGILIPIGGNEDKGTEDSELYTLEFIDDGILFHVVKEAGGINAKIVVIPTASSIPIEVGENYLSAFAKLSCTNVHVLDIRSKEDSEKKSSIDLIKSTNKASTSFLQRNFQIGYNKAARIMEVLEDRGVVSKASHTGKREILITN